MKFRSIAAAIAAVFSILVFAGSGDAQGVIVPAICDARPCVRPPRPPSFPAALPVKSIKLGTKIEGQIATTHVEQVFRNDTPHTLEGAYFFPIPDNASVVEFAIWENGKRLVAEVRSREEARRIYDEIVRKQRDPGLLEYAGKDLLQASIFPIPGNSDKKLELIYSEVLKAESGTVSYHYPLGTGRNTWIRSVTEQRPTQSPPQPVGTVSGSIEVVGREPLRNIYSPTHQLEVKKLGDSAATITFEAKNNDSDLQLFYGLSDAEFGLSLITYREPGKDGYFLLMLSPRDDISERELVNKDIVFVLDTSGSMAGEEKMEKARKALLFGIRTLRNGDRFNVIGFSGEEQLMERGLIAADQAGRSRGEDFVNKLRPTGGTNINDSLTAALKQFDDSRRPKMLVFMTDGQPTVGETNVDRIISNMKSAKKDDIRIFPFGFGYDVNTRLLDRIGSESAGMSDYVQPKEDLEIKVSNFFSRVSSPVLSELNLDMGTVMTEFMYPRQLGDLFRGMQLTVVGRYKNADDLKGITARLTGRTGAAARSFQFANLKFPLRDEDNRFLPRLWASRRVGWLLEQVRSNGENKEVRDEIVDLATRYGLVTPYTSYLATDGTTANLSRDRNGVLQTAPSARAVADTSGAAAVQISAQQISLQNNTRTTADEKDASRPILQNSAINQFVRNKNFVNQNGKTPIWIDSEFSADKRLPEVSIKFASDEYFRLVKDEPDIAQYLALGEQVVVVWKGKVYRITN